MNVIFSSLGNDSIALVQWAKEENLKCVSVVYCDTLWSHPWWVPRISFVREWCESIGFEFIHLKSEGMEALVRRKKGWPMPASKMQFCTQELKVKPANTWLERVDPEKEADCYIGIRREESRNRKDHPEWIHNSEKHGGRDVCAPLVRHTEKMRNNLLFKTPFNPLPHRSLECFPCVCANRADLRLLADWPCNIEKIERIERELGFTRNNKPRTMFRPYRHMGATGIREVIKWAQADRGAYNLPSNCTSGYCGD